MRFFFVVFDSDSVGSNDDVLIEGQPGELCVQVHDLHVQASGILDGERVEIDLSDQVDILIVDFSHGDCQILFPAAHINSLYYTTTNNSPPS